MITNDNLAVLCSNGFEVLAQTNRMVWVRSKKSGEEFVITDYLLWRHSETRPYPWHVYHRHTESELCHYHANERSFADVARHMIAHDRKAVWRQEVLAFSQRSTP